MHIRYFNMALALVLAALMAACGKAENAPRTDSGTQAIDTAQLAPGAPARPADTPAAQAQAVDTVVPTHIAVLETSKGRIEIELYGNDAPKTVKNFVGLAERGFYDGLAFHRVVPNFMVQTGDSATRDLKDRSAWGTGDASIYGGSFADELDKTKPSASRGYVTGIVAMANGGPNTNKSQFFIVLNTMGAAHLEYKYTIFGAVRSGMDALHGIEQTGFTGENPEGPAILKKVTIKTLPAASGVAADTTAKKPSA